MQLRAVNLTCVMMGAPGQATHACMPAWAQYPAAHNTLAPWRPAVAAGGQPEWADAVPRACHDHRGAADGSGQSRTGGLAVGWRHVQCPLLLAHKKLQPAWPSSTLGGVSECLPRFLQSHACAMHTRRRHAWLQVLVAGSLMRSLPSELAGPLVPKEVDAAGNVIM